jgi:hypothetical protein
MAVVVVLIVVLIAALVAIRVLQRRRRDEIRSIHHYHDRLDSLHVEQHDRGGSVRVVQGEFSPPQVSAPDRPRLDPEAAHIDTAGPYASDAELRRRHDRDWAIERMQPRARVDTATILIVAVVAAVLVAIALAGYLIQRGRGSLPTTTSTTTTLRPTSTTARTSSFVPSSTSNGVAVYALPTGTYAVTVTGTSGPVWVSATSPLTSTRHEQRVVARGATSSFTFTRASMVELGAPGNASVQVDGAPVVFPAPLVAPLTLQFSG